MSSEGFDARCICPVHGWGPDHAAENARLREENSRLRRVLEFYADPGTYHAVAMFFDHPCGGFDEDFSEDHGDAFYDRPMPGKRAREVLKEGF